MCYFTSCLPRNRIIKIKLNSPAELYLFEEKLGSGNYTATRSSNFAWLYFFSYRPLKFDNLLSSELKNLPNKLVLQTTGTFESLVATISRGRLVFRNTKNFQVKSPYL